MSGMPEGSSAYIQRHTLKGIVIKVYSVVIITPLHWERGDRIRRKWRDEETKREKHTHRGDLTHLESVLPSLHGSNVSCSVAGRVQWEVEHLHLIGGHCAAVKSLHREEGKTKT